MLGIIGAMEVEVEKLRAKMTETEMKTVAGMNFCKGKLEGKDVVIVRSGIGKVNAGICSQILVDLYQVDGIVNTGIAGSLRNEINIGGSPSPHRDRSRCRTMPADLRADRRR